MFDPNPPAIVGEVEAGRAEKVRKEINKIIKATTSSTFDLAELLHESKSKNYFRNWGFETFTHYAKSLELKYSKSYYLVRVVTNMKAAGLTREEYEPVGMTKLRVISKLDPEAEYKEVPGSLAIRELTLKAGQMTAEEVALEVDELMGLTEDESMVWLNIHLKKLARENIVKPAIELARKHIGTVKTDEEGQAVDAGEGAALEVICANFLADPNFSDPDPEPVKIPEATEDDAAELQAENEGGNVFPEEILGAKQ